MAGEKDTKKGVKGTTIGKPKIQERQPCPHHQRVEDARGGRHERRGPSEGEPRSSRRSPPPLPPPPPPAAGFS